MNELLQWGRVQSVKKYKQREKNEKLKIWDRMNEQ